MNLNRVFLVSLVLLLFCKVNIKAQVTIGSGRASHPGAVLELESQGNQGLLLPVISLTNASNWKLGGTSVEGMVVYNTAADRLKGKGLYIWTGSEWKETHQITCSGVPNVGAITISKNNVSKNEVFQAWVAPVTGTTQYIWDLTGGVSAVGYSNTNIISLAGLSAGTVKISVKAINPCGEGATQTATVTIKNN
ncbi:MAG: hypothetical protein LBQ84_09225 [Flavobacteriaceae bacterium]|jgi:hypothetical protein|nr:hypothetical protein [Flavobacteriaceae bacterium]